MPEQESRIRPEGSTRHAPPSLADAKTISVVKSSPPPPSVRGVSERASVHNQEENEMGSEGKERGLGEGRGVRNGPGSGGHNKKRGSAARG